MVFDPITRPGLGHKVKGGSIGERKELSGVSPSAASTHTRHSRAHMHTHRVRLTRGLPTPRSMHKTANKARAQLVRPLSEAHISISGTCRHDRRTGRASRNRTKGCFQCSSFDQLDRRRQIPWDCLMRSAFTAFPATRKSFLGTGSHLCGLQKKAIFSGSPLQLHKHMCMGTPHTHWPSHTT